MWLLENRLSPHRRHRNFHRVKTARMMNPPNVRYPTVACSRPNVTKQINANTWEIKAIQYIRYLVIIYGPTKVLQTDVSGMHRPLSRDPRQRRFPLEWKL